MTLQQLQYIIAVDKYRSFAKAAQHCEITQPTLSKMIAKLEEELEVRIFQRSNRSVEPTKLGARIIEQATKTVREAERINDIVFDNVNVVTGDLRISVGPSIAPYILPRFIRFYSSDFPHVSLFIEEMRRDSMFEAIDKGLIDIGIAIGDNRRDGILEIPVYEEPFWVYVAENCVRQLPAFTPEHLSHESMWVMKEAQCLRDSAFSFCKARETGRRIYEAGNIETLVRVVDENGGFTIIPEMHLPLLSPSQHKNVRPLTGECLSMRRVSLYIRKDFTRQKTLNSVVSTLLKVVPREMLKPAVLRGNIRL
ncbi:MAG: LysR family transcriptional regulator [Muribaculaceae bacterium]